jgi:flavodoxin
MKPRLTLFAALLALVFSCNRKPEPKDLVVYFSQTGNTEQLAQLFAEQTGADLLLIECEQPYPDSYEGTIEMAGPEIREGVCRPIKNGPVDLEAYRTVYLGYPVWFGSVPPPVLSFVSANDFSSKEVVLFCTYGSGGVKSSSRALEKWMPETRILGRFGIAARRMAYAPAEVAAFLLGLTNGASDDEDGYSEPREVVDSDLELFRQATAGYDYLNLRPLMVSVRESEGECSRIFVCESSHHGGAPRKVEVLILQKGEDAPYLQSVETLQEN